MNTVENKIKAIIGEQAVQIAVLASQLEEAQKRIQELESKEEKKED